MKTLPLFYYPSTWVWVDDDKTLLSAMTEIFNKKNHVRSFQSGGKCLSYLKRYKSYLAEQSFLRNTAKDINNAVNINAILKLRNDPSRHEEITAMVIDYNMPEINGLELAKLTQQPLIPKILLTGNMPAEIIAEDIHRNLINRVVQKGEEGMLKKLAVYLEKLSLEYFQAMSASLLSSLELDGRLSLSDPTFIDFFETYCQRREIREYYLIEKHGSFFCIDRNGVQSCLVVHTHQSIENWLSINGNKNSLNPVDLVAIKENKKIPFFGIGKEAGDFDPAVWPQYLHESQILEGKQTYFWAMVPVV